MTCRGRSGERRTPPYCHYGNPDEASGAEHLGAHAQALATVRGVLWAEPRHHRQVSGDDHNLQQGNFGALLYFRKYVLDQSR